mmetsp:Transcript_55443/g.117872  ORF Transcript_55443/g.117872 Transcript_55443/m.117872 type:complete len:86 (+) Transcript_55443:1714-1971(+)
MGRLKIDLALADRCPSANGISLTAPATTPAASFTRPGGDVRRTIGGRAAIRANRTRPQDDVRFDGIHSIAVAAADVAAPAIMMRY